MVTRTTEAQRWQQALRRAHAEHITLYQDTATGDYYALSSDGRTLYGVTPTTCACKAGQRGWICKHRALLLARLGRLSDDSEPEPTAPASLAALPVPNGQAALPRDLPPIDEGLTPEQIYELKLDAMRISRELGYLFDWKTGTVDAAQPFPRW